MSYLSPQITTKHRKMLLCISGQGLITVHAPKPPITQNRPSILTNILQIPFFFPRLLYQAIKSPLNSFAYPFRTPLPNIPKTSSNDLQDTDNDQPPIPETSTTPNNDQTMEQSNPTTTSPVSYATASSNEFDIDNETWKEAWRFANHITFSLRLQIARGYMEGKMYRERLEDIVELRELESRVWELEGRAWECGGVDNEGGG